MTTRQAYRWQRPLAASIFAVGGIVAGSLEAGASTVYDFGTLVPSGSFMPGFSQEFQTDPMSNKESVLGSAVKLDLSFEKFSDTQGKITAIFQNISNLPSGKKSWVSSVALNVDSSIFGAPLDSRFSFDGSGAGGNPSCVDRDYGNPCNWRNDPNHPNDTHDHYSSNFDKFGPPLDGWFFDDSNQGLVVGAHAYYGPNTNEWAGTAQDEGLDSMNSEGGVFMWEWDGDADFSRITNDLTTFEVFEKLFVPHTVDGVGPNMNFPAFWGAKLASWTYSHGDKWDKIGGSPPPPPTTTTTPEPTTLAVFGVGLMGFTYLRRSRKQKSANA